MNLIPRNENSTYHHTYKKNLLVYHNPIINNDHCKAIKVGYISSENFHKSFVFNLFQSSPEDIPALYFQGTGSFWLFEKTSDRDKGLDRIKAGFEFTQWQRIKEGK